MTANHLRFQRSRRVALVRAAAVISAAAMATLPATARAQDAPRGFFQAIARDDDSEVRVYLLRGASVSARNETGTPALVFAAAERAFKVVRTFLAIPGTEVDIPNKAGETALMYAALHGDLDATQLLIEKGAEVNRTGWTPLHYAATGGSEAVLRFLLENYAYIDAESPNRTTPLMLAVRHRHDALARTLIAEGADPAVRNDAGLTAADYAQQAGDRVLSDWIRSKATEFNATYRPTGTVRR